MVDQTEIQESRTVAQLCCRFCESKKMRKVLDLGTSPLCQKHVKLDDLGKPEKFYPLQLFVCEECWLVQIEEFTGADDIFDGDYAYFSSFSTSWLDHCKAYAAKMVSELNLTHESLVMEAASNDGYLLQYFKENDIPVLGIEPTQNTADAAIQIGVRTEVRFLGVDTAHDLISIYGKADLLIGNNVLAHVPDLNDFVAGLAILLGPDGVLTMEFPHLDKLISLNQFDTIYHEHFSYFSLSAANRIFAKHGIMLFDVEELTTHGGSLRIYGRHASQSGHLVTSRFKDMLAAERAGGVETVGYYMSFEGRVMESKRCLVEFLIEQKRAGKKIVGYGAPGKGNTLLNYCGIRTDFLDYTVDRNPHKQGNYLPGTRIPILHPDTIFETKPDFVLLLPWNLKGELSAQLADVKNWGGKLVVPIPTVQVL